MAKSAKTRPASGPKRARLQKLYKDRVDLESARMALDLKIHQLEDEIADSFGGTGIVLPDGSKVDIACRKDDDGGDNGKKASSKAAKKK